MQSILAPVYCGGKCGARMHTKERKIEDEIMSNNDVDSSFESVFNEISDQIDLEDASIQHTCPFAGGMGGMPGMGGLDALGGLGAMGMLGALGGANAPNMDGDSIAAAFDPEVIVRVVYQIMDTLEDRVKDALEALKVGVCPQINPVDIFLSQTPYHAFQEIMTRDEGEKALVQMDQLRAELKSKFPAL